MDDDQVPTPADLLGHAGYLEAQAQDIEALHERLRGADDKPTRRVGFRLEDIAGELRKAAAGLQVTAEELARIRSRNAMSQPVCGAQWGVCPEHGNTLSSSGGRSWCRVPGCGRSWGWDRGGLPCTEAAAWRLLDQKGGEMILCEGHAIAARAQLEGGRLVPMGPGR
jgi:hypothetical protein